MKRIQSILGLGALLAGCVAVGWWARGRGAAHQKWSWTEAQIPEVTAFGRPYLIRMNPTTGETEYLAKVPIGESGPMITWLPVSDREEVRDAYFKANKQAEKPAP